LDAIAAIGIGALGGGLAKLTKKTDQGSLNHEEEDKDSSNSSCSCSEGENDDQRKMAKLLKNKHKKECENKITEDRVKVALNEKLNLDDA